MQVSRASIMLINHSNTYFDAPYFFNVIMCTFLEKRRGVVTMLVGNMLHERLQYATIISPKPCLVDVAHQ